MDIAKIASANTILVIEEYQVAGEKAKSRKV